jgi:hypothetical protein
MIKVAAVFVACSALAVTAYSQAASEGGVRTRFQADHTKFTESGRAEVYGHVTAAKRKCRSHRKAVLYFNRVDRRHRVDSDWSSRHASVGLRGHWRAKPHRFFVIVRRKRVDHYTCMRYRYLRTHPPTP